MGCVYREIIDDGTQRARARYERERGREINYSALRCKAEKPEVRKFNTAFAEGFDDSEVKVVRVQTYPRLTPLLFSLSLSLSL